MSFNTLFPHAQEVYGTATNASSIKEREQKNRDLMNRARFKELLVQVKSDSKKRSLPFIGMSDMEALFKEEGFTIDYEDKNKQTF